MTNAQEWLDKNYPKNGCCINKDDKVNYGKQRKEIINLFITKKSLEETLEIKGFDKLKSFTICSKLTGLHIIDCPQLTEIWCYDNQLKDLSVDNLPNIMKLGCRSNQLTDLDLSNLTNPAKLVSLGIADNKFSENNLSFLSEFVNLEELYLGNNRFIGSLEPLKDLVNLKILDISNTDIDSGLKYLPDNLEKIYCDAKKNNACKKIREELEKSKKCVKKDKNGKKYYDFLAWKKTQNNISITSSSSSKTDLSKDDPTIIFQYEKDEMMTQEKLNDLTSQKDKKINDLNQQLTAANVLITNVQNLLGIDDLNNLPQIPEGENLTSLLGRPTHEQLKTEQKKVSDLETKLKKIEEEVSSTERPILKHVIGKGGHGKVYYGKWKLQDVAVKELYISFNDISQDDIKEISNEINILKKLKNAHIIQYYGVYSNDSELLIIMDYAENGTLTKFINENKDKEHDWNFNASLVKQITLGLAYIHRENIIHRDLKSLNILLARNNEVKISDFGLSKTETISSPKSKYSGAVVGTLRWMAPELLKNKRYSEQSDIYSLGMVIWEIAAKCTIPFKGIGDTLAMLKVLSNEKETIPSDIPNDIQNIIQQCWKDIPDERIILERILEIIGDSEANFQTVGSNDNKLLDTDKNLLKSHNNKEIDEQYGGSSSMNLDINNFNLNQTNSQEQSSHQSQIQIPSKGNN